MAPQARGVVSVFHPLGAPQPPLTHRDREPLFIVITNGGVGNRWAREIRWPFPGCRSAQPLNGCGRGGGGEVQKHIGVVFFCMFWVSSVCSSCCVVDEIDRDKQTTGTNILLHFHFRSRSRPDHLIFPFVLNSIWDRSSTRLVLVSAVHRGYIYLPTHHLSTTTTSSSPQSSGKLDVDRPFQHSHTYSSARQTTDTTHTHVKRDDLHPPTHHHNHNHPNHQNAPPNPPPPLHPPPHPRRALLPKIPALHRPPIPLRSPLHAPIHPPQPARHHRHAVHRPQHVSPFPSPSFPDPTTNPPSPSS